MGWTWNHVVVIGVSVFGLFAGASGSNPSPWKPDRATVKLINGTKVTQAEFDANSFASAAVGQISKDKQWCLGALVTNQHFIFAGVSFCRPPSFQATTVRVGSIYSFGESQFDGGAYAVSGVTEVPGSHIQIAKFPPLPLTSKAKPVPLPPANLLHTPPPVGAKCQTFGYGAFQPSALNRLVVTIVDIKKCQELWTDSFVVPQDGSVFCAWVTKNGSAEADGAICAFDNPSLLICQDWSQKPPTPSCGWHRQGRGGGPQID